MGQTQETRQFKIAGVKLLLADGDFKIKLLQTQIKLGYVSLARHASN